MGLHRRAGDRVMPRQCRLHPLGFLLPQAGAALDVGEQNGRDRGWLVHARARCVGLRETATLRQRASAGQRPRGELAIACPLRQRFRCHQRDRIDVPG